MESLLSHRARSSSTSAIRDLLRLTEQPSVLSLAGGLPAAEALPSERIAVAADRVLRICGRYGAVALQYGPTEGDTGLREVVAARMNVDPETVVITTGSQQGLELLAKALLDRGDHVAVASPTYLGALQAMRGADPTFVPVPEDDDGIETDALRSMLESGLRLKACYVVSSFANPTGVTMSVGRRRDLMELADRYGFVVVDDDPYGELRFRGVTPPPLRCFGDRIVSLGTASKIVAPGLRCGWMSAPTWLRPSVIRLKQATDLHTSSLSQLITADLLCDAPFMSKHLHNIRDMYRERCDILHRSTSDFLESKKPEGGLFLWTRLPWSESSTADTTALLNHAINEGVAFVPGSAFDVCAKQSASMRLSFASLDAAHLTEASARLRTASTHELPLPTAPF